MESSVCAKTQSTNYISLFLHIYFIIYKLNFSLHVLETRTHHLFWLKKLQLSNTWYIVDLDLLFNWFQLMDMKSSACARHSVRMLIWIRPVSTNLISKSSLSVTNSTKICRSYVNCGQYSFYYHWKIICHYAKLCLLSNNIKPKLYCHKYSWVKMKMNLMNNNGYIYKPIC